MVIQYGPYSNPVKKGEWNLPEQGAISSAWGGWGNLSKSAFRAQLDSWSDPPRIWVSEPWLILMVHKTSRRTPSTRVYELGKDGIKQIQDLRSGLSRDKIPVTVPIYYRQRLYADPVTGRLYVAEGDNAAVGKSFHNVFEINPENGEIKNIQIPFNAEDMCFGIDGSVFLRTVNVVGRFQGISSLQEVPWDYGEERSKIGFGWMSSTRYANLISVLVMPSDGNWHHGGMHVSPRGNLAVGCVYGISMKVRTNAKYVHRGKKYRPKLFAGRQFGGRGGTTCVHVWDKHAKIKYEDTFPGVSDLYGVGIDNKDGIYVMTSKPRMIGDKPYPHKCVGTFIKAIAGMARVLTVGKGVELPLSETNIPKRPKDLINGWVERAEWIYGGAGFGGKNVNGCACWNDRFAFDYFSRSFIPELDRYHVAVLDSNGNLILRIGKYGNADDGKPLIPHPGIPNPRSIGGDEVALFHGAYLAAYTDRRLFIADPGNSRILSVLLRYHTEEKIPLRQVPDQ